MNRIAITVALVATLAIAAPTSAAAPYMVQSPNCGEASVFNGPTGWSVRLVSSTFSHAPYRFRFTHDGTSTFAIAAGGYGYQFINRNGVARGSGFVTIGC